VTLPCLRMGPRDWILVVGATLVEACFLALVLWGFA
jgi:hypothetical protein